MAIAAIVAVDRKLAIGRAGKLPWHYSADLKFFQETTSDNAIVMGHTTWKSIGKPLPNRLNIVLSRTAELEKQPGVLQVMRSKTEVLEFAKNYGRDVFIIGGAQVFAEFVDAIDKWLVTEIPLTVEDADTFLPADFLDGFALKETKELGEELVVNTYSRK
jgi:dihydrofolate reductase